MPIVAEFLSARDSSEGTAWKTKQNFRLLKCKFAKCSQPITES